MSLPSSQMLGRLPSITQKQTPSSSCTVTSRRNSQEEKIVTNTRKNTSSKNPETFAASSRAFPKSYSITRLTLLPKSSSNTTSINITQLTTLPRSTNNTTKTFLSTSKFAHRHQFIKRHSGATFGIN